MFPCASSVFTVQRNVREDLTDTVTSVCLPSIFCFPFSQCFCFRCVFLMDPLLHPEYLLLLLEQIEGYTRLFLALASLTTYPDNALCVFYDEGHKCPLSHPLLQKLFYEIESLGISVLVQIWWVPLLFEWQLSEIVWQKDCVSSWKTVK